KGETSLGDGTRVKKHHPRVRAMGGLDEANAALGVALLHIDNASIRKLLARVQNDMFDLGADLCRPERTDEKKAPLRVTDAQVTALEHDIDRSTAPLKPLSIFVLPGGSPASAHLHLARGVLRRAERDMTELMAAEPLNPALVKYVNRLSDLLFVLARYLNAGGENDILWQPGLNR